MGQVPMDVQIKRLEQPFFQIQRPAAALAFVRQEPLFARQFLLRRQYPSDSVLADQLTRLATNDGLRKFAAETQAVFGDFKPEASQLRSAFQHVKFYFPDFRVPPVYTFISGLSQDVLVNDSLLVLGLDFFAGPKASYRPNVPGYLLRRYQRPYLVPQAVLQISNKYVKENAADRTLLNQMVQLGKSYYFLDKVMPCTPDSLKIGFTARELVGVAYNGQKIWAHFLTQKLLYQTQPFLTEKYVGERPNTAEIGKEAPGRIGAWVGWQIVRAYMAENPSVTLAQLLAEEDAQKILNGPKYKPKKH
ncbi:MAG: gliding motility lipoprotein GldB [Hymenobacteraceae bacterium]|nr:gliding motility lipoprotein GldB [Hymenobacteraceae bacterium]